MNPSGGSTNFNRDIRQGVVYDLEGSCWIVVDSFPNDDVAFSGLHCAPILSPDESPMLDLDVRIARAGGFASLGLLKKLNKAVLTSVVTDATPAELARLRTNLVTWFSVFSYDSDFVATLPRASLEEAGLLPGMILAYKKTLVCIVDHWGCYNSHPLVYVAPVVADLDDQNTLDVDITSDYRDLFGKRFFVRANDFFQVEKEELVASLNPDKPIPMLRYGATRRISRSMVLKFGELGLLL